MASIEEILAQYEASKSASSDMSIADQYMALQGLSGAKKKDEGPDIFQPVRTAFSAFAAPGGLLAGQIAPEAYAAAEEEQRAALGVTDESPWYERVEAMPGAGGVLTGAMSPEFKASGVGRIAAPVTQILGDMALDPTTYIGVGAAKGAGMAARAAGAGNLMDAAGMVPKLRAAERAAAVAGGATDDVLKGLDAAAAMERAKIQAGIATKVLTEGTGLQKAAYRAGGFLQQAEPVAFAAPAALAYGPQTIAAAWEQAKGIPESETPIADAASVALLGGLTVLMGQGLKSAGDSLTTWQKYAREKGLADDVIKAGEDKVIAAANEMAEPPVYGPQPFIGPVEPKGFEMTEAPERFGPPRPETGFALQPEPVVSKPQVPRGRMGIEQFPVKEPVIPEIDPNAVSLVADPLPEAAAQPEFIDPSAVRVVQKPLDNQVANFIRKNGGANAPGMADMLRRRFKATAAQASSWVEDAKIPEAEVVPDVTPKQARAAQKTAEDAAVRRAASSSIARPAPEFAPAVDAKLQNLGYTPEDIAAMTPEQRQKIVTLETQKPRAVPEDAPVPPTAERPFDPNPEWTFKRKYATTTDEQWAAMGTPEFRAKIDAEWRADMERMAEADPEFRVKWNAGDESLMEAAKGLWEQRAEDLRDKMAPPVIRATAGTLPRKAEPAPVKEDLTEFATEGDEMSRLQKEESDLLAKLQRDGDLPPAEMTRLETINGRISQLLDEPDTMGEPTPQRAAAKAEPLTEPTEAAGTAPKLLTDQDLPNPVKNTAPVEPAAEPPKVETPAPPKEEPTGTSKAAPEALSAEEQKAWANYKKTLETYPIDQHFSAEEREGAEVIRTARLKEASELTDPAQIRAILDKNPVRPKKGRSAWRQQNPNSPLGHVDKELGRVARVPLAAEGAAEKVGGSTEDPGGSKVEQAAEGRQKSLTKGQQVDVAIGAVKAKYGSLRAWMDSADSGTLEWTKSGKDPVNLRDKSTMPGKIWNEYVDAIDKGMSDAAARTFVSEKLKASSNTVQQVAARGRKLASESGQRSVLEGSDLDAPLPVFDKEAYSKLKVGVDKKVIDLTDQLDAMGTLDAAVLKSPELKGKIEELLNEYGLVFRMASGKLGSNTTIQNRDALRNLAIKLGVPEKEMARKGAPEIAQRIADTVGSSKDYLAYFREGSVPINKPITKPHVVTALHPGLKTYGGRDGVDLHATEGIKDPTVLANDIVKNAEVNRLFVPTPPKGINALKAELQKHGITLEAGKTVETANEQGIDLQVYDVKRPRVEEMEWRNPNYKPRTVEVEVNGQKIEIDPEVWQAGLNMSDDEAIYRMFKSDFPNELEAELKKLGIDGFDKAAFRAIKSNDGRGMYHRVFVLPGATREGESYVIRVGRNPHIDLPTPAQRALVQPVVSRGILGKSHPNASPYFWTLHKTNRRQKALERSHVADYGRTGQDLLQPKYRNDPPRLDVDLFEGTQAVMQSTGQLPPNMSLMDNFRYMRELQDAAEAAGLQTMDWVVGPFLRGSQIGWLDVTGERIPDGSVVYRTKVNGQDRAYKLVLNDYGTAFPAAHTIPPGSPWLKLDHSARLALMKAQGIANAPDSRVSWRDSVERLEQYAQDLNNGLQIGNSSLKLVNHDRIMSGEFLQKYEALAWRPSIALKNFHDRLAKLVTDAGLNVGNTEFAGFTASPHLAGLYHEQKGVGRVFLNLAEAVNHAPSYDQAVDDLLYAMIHEVTHGKYSGHGTGFRDLDSYIRALAKAEGLFDEGRGLLKEGFSKADYERVKTELVPEYTKARSEYGTVEAGRNAEDLAGVSAGRAAGSTEAIPNRRGGDQADLQGDLDSGVRPGADVQGGRQGEAGQLRGGTAAGRASAATSAEGRTTGSAAGESGRPEEGGVRDQVEGRIDEKRAPARSKSDIQGLMDDLLEAAKADLRPVRDVFRGGYELASRYVDHMTHDEMLEAANSLPSPRHPDQKLGVLNLLHYPDMDLKMKARIAKWYEFTKGAWPRDKVEKWDDIGEDVRDLLGVHTAEEWTRLYSSKGGGFTSKDIELLRQVNNELTGRVMDAENRLYDGLQNNVTGETLQKLRDQLSYQERAYYHSMLNTTRALTGTGRALAIARHEIRDMDPILRMEQDMAAGLRERLRFKFKDKGVVEDKVAQLMETFNDIRKQKDGNWEEFYKAYNAMLGSRLWPDKILEFYKAGLLGWPSRVANISSNTLFRAVRYVEDAMAGAIDKAYSGVTGAARSRYVGEAAVSAMAMRRALSEGFRPWLKAQGDAFALRPEDVSHALSKGSLMEDLMQHPGAINGKLGEFIRFPFKGLSSDDALAKHMSRVDNMYRQIYRKVRSGEYKLNPGETHTAATERIYSTLNDNFQAALKGGQFEFEHLKSWQKMATVAEEAAKSDTFQADLGNFGRGANWLLRNVPALQVVFPFVRTPTNIAKETIKRTPLGLIDIARKWKGLSEGERITEVSKVAVGSLVGAGLMMKALDGSVTGGGPLDPDELETLKATGWQPYSVKVGDQWVSYQRFEPIAAIMGIAADSAEGLRNGDFQKWQTGAMRVFSTTAENITNKTFLSGLDGMFSAVSHPKQYLNRFVKQMQGSVIPNSLGFVPVSGITRALDPVYRQSDALSMNVFYAKLPYLSSTLDPQYGPTGEERLRTGTALERVISPFARTTVKTGPQADGAEEVVRLSAAPKAPGRYWIGRGGVRVDFTGEEKAAIAKAYREATFTIGQRLVKDPNYKKMPDDEFDPNYKYGMKTKKDIIRKVYNGYRDRVMDRIKPSLEQRAYKQVATQREG